MMLSQLEACLCVVLVVQAVRRRRHHARAAADRGLSEFQMT